MLVKKLENAVITWEQPWYQLSTCLTRPFKEPADAHEEQYEMGTMTKDEIDHIAKNWRKFIKKFDVPDKLICLARWRNKELNQRLPEEKARVFVIAYLARGLKRTMSQIYKHIVSYYGGCNKGQYSKDEEKVMGICFHHCPKKAVTILSTVLAREPRGIYKRLYFTTNGKLSKML
ncbi:unnamed protein product [Diatraea saccharalis]|uniref:Uncharacterized protein n=1 Tax=Diatraea saccharalis TaxID=40085 RepID=A0A9N9WLJ5_9NEOP|nr:unnamed protein product [Diatraea saccharalis]